VVSPFRVLRLCREDAVNEIRILASIKSKNIVRLVAGAAGKVALQRMPAQLSWDDDEQREVIEISSH